MSAKLYDCAIVGSGPGGLVSALYLARALRTVVIINEGKPRAAWIPKIRNLIGYSEGLSGPRLLQRLRAQVNQYKIMFREGKACVFPKGNMFIVKVNGRKLLARKVILATGMKDVQPQIPNVNLLRKRGLLGYCPICDGYEYRNARIAMLIDGVYGLKKMKFMARLIPNLHVVAIKDFEVPNEYKEQIRNFGVRFHQGVLMNIKSSGQGIKIQLSNYKPILYKMAYVLLGATVADSAFGHIKKLNRTNEGFLTVSTHQETSIPGLYAVGDCVHGLSQVSVAVGQAAIAAVHINNKLEV